MRRVATALIATAAALAALLSFRSHTPAALGAAAAPAASPSASSGSGSSGGATGGGGTESSSGTGSGSPSSATTATATRAASPAKNGTYTGTSADTQFGPVQVKITVSDGKLSDVTVLQVPDNGRYEQEIVAQALPILRSEALSKQSADIDIVSGATYTSQGYTRSLQSALDQAGI